MTGPVLSHPQGAVLLIKAQPGAQRTGLAGLHGGALKVRVTAAPEKGQANAALVEALCAALHLRRTQVTLQSGATARQKRFLIAGVSAEELTARIDAALQEP